MQCTCWLTCCGSETVLFFVEGIYTVILQTRSAAQGFNEETENVAPGCMVNEVAGDFCIVFDFANVLFFYPRQSGFTL